MNTLATARELLHQRSGPLTRELLLEPGDFGLGKVPSGRKPDATADMVCGFCATGCGLRVHLKQGEAINLTPTTEYPVNLGMACPKGWEALTVLNSPNRAVKPLLRDNAGRQKPVSWDEAMLTFVDRFKAIQARHGPQSIAFLSTGQLPTEEMAFLGALAKFGMGMVHGDGNTRQCMATAVVAYKQAFGFDAPPYTYADFEQSDTIVLIGSNLCIAHPIMWERVVRNPHHPEIIVVDPRMTETAMNATLHLPLEPSLPYHQIIEGILQERIKGLWVICTNPAHSWINQNQCRDILERLDFLVVQDIYSQTETAKMADLVLPSAAWAEKEGCFINSERRIGVIKKVRRAPGEALSDFNIFRLVSHYWGCDGMFAKWKTPWDVFEVLKKCSQDQPCDITGVQSYQQLVESGGIQWPYPAGSSTVLQERRLFEDGVFFHNDGRARFLFEEPRPLPERITPRYPLILLTGRGTAAQWHTQTRTSQSAVLRKLYPSQVFIEINPQDASQLDIQSNEEITVESQRGRIRVRALITNTVQAGQVFLPMHYEVVNQLTHSVFDPYSHQPAYKACAVRIYRAHV